jgi:hypothetical protein
MHALTTGRLHGSAWHDELAIQQRTSTSGAADGTETVNVTGPHELLPDDLGQQL